MMDLDHFKGINDTYGHQFGDTVLLEFSQVLRRIFHPSDIMGRVGGGEFLVFMKDIPSQAIAEEKAAVLCETFRSQVLFESHPGFQLECSAGLALYPTHGTDFHSLYEKADKALYRAKKMAGSTMRFIKRKHHTTRSKIGLIHSAAILMEAMAAYCPAV